MLTIQYISKKLGVIFMTIPGQDLNEIIQASQEEIKNKGNKYTLITDKTLISERKDTAKKLVEKHNN